MGWQDTTVYVVKNAGSSPAATFIVGVPAAPAAVAFAKANTKGGKPLSITRTQAHPSPPAHSLPVEGEGGKLQVKERSGQEGEAYFEVQLSPALAAGADTVVEVHLTLTHLLSPHPKEITQVPLHLASVGGRRGGRRLVLKAESQFVVLETSSRVASPYSVTRQKTTIKLPPGKLESFTKDAPSKHEGEAIVYGAYDGAGPFALAPVKLHVEHNAPFVVVKDLERLVELSNWGNIAVEETLRLAHEGAVLKGPFSRFDFQRDRRERMPVVQAFKTLLPAAARDVYYRDEIGNISTSHLRELDEAVELEIRPRFPLFGGWKTNYYIGYNVPSYEYLFASGSSFVLRMRLLDHVFDNMVIDALTLRIVLPEGATDIKLTTPYPVEREPDTIHHTYLDTSGRPVIVARKRNLVEGHIQDLELTYTFDRLSMVREPLMLIVAFYLLFLAIIAYVRLDFTIAADAGSESRLRAAGLVEKVHHESGERQAAYDGWADAIAAYKASKDAPSFAAAKKKAEAALKTAAGALGELQAQLKVRDRDFE